LSINPTSSVGASTVGAQNESAAVPRPDGLGRDAFLKLLVTQLQHQDPTKPKDDTEFISQLATFSSLDKLGTIDESVKTLGTDLGAQIAQLKTALTTLLKPSEGGE
jgi:flagellar basal-body rod modification protein FlgD